MRKTIFGCLGAAAVAFALQLTPANVQAVGFFNLNCDPCAAVACDPCEPAAWGCDPCGPFNRVGNRSGGWFLNGHVEAGFFANAHGRTNAYRLENGTPIPNGVFHRGANEASGNTALLQNTRLTHAQVNQVYLSAGRAVDGRRGLDIGGTIDFTWGSDAYVVQAMGMENNVRAGYRAAAEGRVDFDRGRERWGQGDYFSALPQAFVEMEAGRLNVKGGKFYLPFGIDSYKSTDNFFYSWSPTMIIAPTTGSGVLSTFALTNNFSVISGWVVPDEMFYSSKYNTLLAGFDWNLNRRMNVRYTFASGRATDEHWLTGNTPGVRTNTFIQSLTVTNQVTRRINYVFDWTLLNATPKFAGERGPGVAVYALMNEIVYQHNSRWAFGTRFGVFNANPLATQMGFAGVSVVDVHGNNLAREAEWNTISLGANWTPNKWLTVKPEIRYDWISKNRGDVRPFLSRGGVNDYAHQFSGGVSAVVSF